MRRRHWLALALTPVLAAASPDGGQPAATPPTEASVRVALNADAVIDWTRLVLVVSGSGSGHGVGAGWSAVEQQARAQVGPRVLSSARDVPVTGDRTVGQIEDDPQLGEAVKSRLSRWTVTEARYFKSGRVELEGELSLLELLKPWTMAHAPPTPVELPAAEPGVTGLVVDARGLGCKPSFLPALVSDAGESLYDGTLYDTVAIRAAPVAYVLDPKGATARGRAGESPVALRAAACKDGAIVLAAGDVARVRSLAAGPLLKTAHLVVALDP